MLTEAEKGWLELRDFCKALVDRFYCLNCQDFFTDDEAFETVCLNPNNCPITTQDFRDAAEFEARVAALLAKNRADGKILRPQGLLVVRNDRGRTPGQENRLPATPRH